jgi:hypothetical protein
MPPRTVSPKIENLVDLMDQRFRLPGTQIRYGYDALLGLVPVVGDVIGALVGLAVVVEALRVRAGWWVVGRMLVNLWLESAIGAVPLVGDVWDVWFKANRRNLELLKRRA